MARILLSRFGGGNVALTPFLFSALLFAATLHAQTEEARTLQVEGGALVAYTLRSHPADAHLARPAKELAPDSALNTAKLLNLHLSSGDIEEAALLSNAPRRRFEVLRDYRESVGPEEFKRVFAQYFYPENRLVAEIAIDRHRLLMWELKTATPVTLAAQYFVEVEGRYLIDDVPNDKRTQLRWVLEAYRSGKLPR
jgi:hypothetical protein